MTLPTRTGYVGLLLGSLALAVLPFFVPPYYVELGTSALVAAMLALSLQLLVGCTGLVSLGHAAFYGLAAYTVYFLSPEGSPRTILLTLPAAVLAAGLAALVVGALSLRTKGFFFLMVTLAFGQMVFFVFHDTKIGGGADGAYLARPTLDFLIYEVTLPRRQRPLGAYYTALILLVVMYLGLVRLMDSLFGRVLTGIRVNDARMRALGYDTTRYKLAAFVIAGMLAGVAGHMWAMHRGFVNPELTGWHRSAEALLMILLGGLGTLHGAIIGALAFTGLAELPQLIAEWRPFAWIPGIGPKLQALSERKLFIEGIVVLLVVIALPHGLTGMATLLKGKPATDRDDPACKTRGSSPGAGQPAKTDAAVD